jgi:hypothetical protein
MTEESLTADPTTLVLREPYDDRERWHVDRLDGASSPSATR